MINVTRSSMPEFSEFCDEIKCLWDSHWLTNMGVKHKEFEAKLTEYLGVGNAALYVNGHLALENIIAAFSFPEGAEVITTPFTFASTTHAIVRNKLKPVFCDINPTDYTMDADKIEALITDKTVAIVPVHVYGNICDVEKIEKIAKSHGLRVIYDAAHAFGVRYKDRGIASFGDASMFSFHATKVFNTIEGGAVCYGDDTLTEILKDLKNFGIHGPESVIHIGGNAKMNEFQAAMGLCNLRHVDGEIEKRRAVAERYRERLSGVPGIILCKPQKDVVSNYAYFPVVFSGYKYDRDKVYDLLKAEDIIARKYFYPLTNDYECYRGQDGFDTADTPVAYDVAGKVLTLPMYADLELNIVDKICDIILR